MGVCLAFILFSKLQGANAKINGVSGAGLHAQDVRSIPLNTQLRYDHLTIDDGLSQNAVLSILQDSKGFLWIGTQDGLNRYDGYDFTVYKYDPDDPNSLSHNSVLSILEDSQGFIWMGTWGGGLNRFDPQTGRFTRYRHDPEDPGSLANDLVAALYEDHQGGLWIGTMGGGLDQFDRTANTFIHHTNDLEDPQSLSSDYIGVIVEGKDDTLWLGTGGFGVEGNGLNWFDPRLDQVIRYQSNPEDPNSLSGNTISSLVWGPDGDLWIGTGGFYLTGSGLNRFDPQTGRVTRFKNNPSDPDSLSNDSVLSLYIDPSRVLWIGTWGGGLDRLDLNTDISKFIHNRRDSFVDQSLSADIVWKLFEDRSGVLWVGTINGGLNKLNPQVQRFRLFRNHPMDATTLGFDVVGVFYEDPMGGVWVGTWGGGLDWVDPRTGEFTHYVANPQQPGGLPDNTIGSVVRDREGALWVGTFGGLAVMDAVTSEFKYYQNDPQNPGSLVNNNVSKIIEDSDGRLWIATLGGLDYYDRPRDRFTHIQLPEGIQPVTLFLDRNGTLWAGTWGQGLISIDPDSLSGNKVEYNQYQHDPENPDSIIDNAVWSIYEDQRGMLWIGTQTGMDRFDRFSDTFQHFPELNRLPNNSVLCILDDEDGKLWISTNNGLIQFDPLRGIWRNFESSDGLQSNEFNSGACLKDQEGFFYFGGVHGFNVFDPQEILPNPLPPPVAISAFRVFNEPTTVDLSGKTALELDYKQNFISFDFAGLDFHAPQRNQYRYRLDGVDKDWVEAGTRRYASYTNLSGGNYIFQVQASNNDGVWNESGLSLPIRVTPPVWQTWWFQAALALLGALIIAGGVGLRLRQAHTHTRRLEAEVDQRTGALRLVNERLAEEVEQRKAAEEELARHAQEDLERSKDELNRSEARYRALFDSSSVGIGMLSLDRRLIDANPALCMMLGYTREELLEITYPELVYSDDLETDREQFEEIQQSKRRDYQVEKRYQRKDGSLMWGRGTLSVVRDPHGQPQFIVGMLEDITERRQTQEALLQSEARFRTMFDHASIPMALISLERKAMAINPAAERVLGYQSDDLIDRFTSDVIHVDDVASDRDEFQALIEGRSDTYQVEKRYLTIDGKYRWGRITHTLVRGAENQPLYLLSMMEDIDEQRRARERLAAREAEYRLLLEQTVQVRTHELREANTRLEQEIKQRERAEEALAVKAAEEAVTAERTRLARDLHDAVTQTLFSASLVADILPELWKTDPEEARRSTDELRQLTRGALAEMRTLLLELRPTAITQARFEDLLRQLVEALIGRARLPIQLQAVGSRTLPPDVQVVFYRIAQEALNNVVKYAKASQVIVDLQMSPGGAHLEIRDNGVGFDPTRTPPTSLGQRIMRERAESIDADLQVISAIGQGTSVTVTWNDESLDNYSNTED